MNTESLLVETDLYGFFRERLDEAALHRRARVSEGTLCYLAQMLAEAGHEEPTPGPDDTLAELHAQAAFAPPGQAVRLLKRIGDWSLLLTGYFREHLERRRLSRAYCARMGEGAYGRLSGMFRDDTLSPVFSELAGQYNTCSAVIAEVRDEGAVRSDADLLRLYEEWLRSGSPRVAERLSALGMVPGKVQGGEQ